MMKVFKTICFLTTLALLAFTVSAFATDLIAQKRVMFDGPLAWASAYAFYFNRLTLILFFGLLTIPVYNFSLSKRARTFFRVGGIICLILSCLSFGLIAVEQFNMGMPLEFLLETYLYQFAFILASFVIWRIGFISIKTDSSAIL